MKKFKKGAISSYYQYQLDKVKRKHCKLLVFIGVLLVGTFLVTGRFNKDLDQLLIWLKVKVIPIQPSVYLYQSEIDYDAYIAPQVTKGIYIPQNKIRKYEEYIELAK